MTADEIQPDAYPPPTAAGPSPETAEGMRDLDYPSPHTSDPLPHYFGDLLH
ncbi:hypothetical protein Scani_79370 [Streptomyces caniferus]|uniref:Uncharacterized protein n=1 Tax=Streptomyces caniferus TaxID=285557 RepID=A0A640SJQ3_9ACTN|nr:hypothetical protein [Streptomyces caniferus]GFE11669.1 hypothetical protein Scani_79370 [Streptomyces caniferus]